MSWFNKWIKCTIENAEKYSLTHKKVERTCDECCSANPSLPECHHTRLFQEEPVNACQNPPYGEECFGTPIKPTTAGGQSLC